MSLDELLNDKENNPNWKSQKKKLVRIFFGVLIISLALVIGVALAFSVRSEVAEVEKTPIVENEAEAAQIDEIIHLMRLRLEATKLYQRIKEEEKSLNRKPIAERRIASLENRVSSPQPQPNSSPSPVIINYDPGELFLRVSQESQPVYIPTGAVFRARLITPIKTSLQRTLVIAETTHEFRMDMNRKIPKLSRLIGSARLNPVLKGVIVEFDKLVLPNGIETDLRGLALSENALPELDGLYFSDNLQNYGTALAFGFLSGFADAARTREGSIYGSVPEQSVSNQVLAGLSNASFQVAEDILRDIRERAIEYVVVPAGMPIFVTLTERYNIQRGDNL